MSDEKKEKITDTELYKKLSETKKERLQDSEEFKQPKKEKLLNDELLNKEKPKLEIKEAEPKYIGDLGKIEHKDYVPKFENSVKSSELKDNWNHQAALYDEVILNWIRTRAISELLIEKGIITEEEYINKINKLIDRDSDNLINYICYGIVEPKREL